MLLVPTNNPRLKKEFKTEVQRIVIFQRKFSNLCVPPCTTVTRACPLCTPVCPPCIPVIFVTHACSLCAAWCPRCHCYPCVSAVYPCYPFVPSVCPLCVRLASLLTLCAVLCLCYPCMCPTCSPATLCVRHIPLSACVPAFYPCCPV